MVGSYHLTPEAHAALMAESQRVRELLASKRAERIELPLERRKTDRRVSERRSMQDALNEAAAKHDGERKFTGAPISALMGL